MILRLSSIRIGIAGIGVGLLVLVALAGQRSIRPALLSLANVLINKEVWQNDRDAVERQATLDLAARIMETGLAVSRESSVAISRETHSCSMVQSVARAEYYRRRREFEAAAYWLHQAASAIPHPAVQSAILVPTWVSVTSQGDISLEWNQTNWRLYGRSLSFPESNTSARLDEQNNIMTLSYQNDVSQRDQVAYTWRGSLSIPYWHTIHIRTDIHPDTFLTVEVASSSDRQRLVSYHQGNEGWEDFTFWLPFDSIQEIVLGLGEPHSGSKTPSYIADVDSVTFLLDQGIGSACNH